VKPWKSNVVGVVGLRGVDSTHLKRCRERKSRRGSRDGFGNSLLECPTAMAGWNSVGRVKPKKGSRKICHESFAKLSKENPKDRPVMGKVKRGAVNR